MQPDLSGDRCALPDPPMGGLNRISGMMKRHGSRQTSVPLYLYKFSGNWYNGGE